MPSGARFVTIALSALLIAALSIPSPTLAQAPGDSGRTAAAAAGERLSVPARTRWAREGEARSRSTLNRIGAASAERPSLGLPGGARPNVRLGGPGGPALEGELRTLLIPVSFEGQTVDGGTIGREMFGHDLADLDISVYGRGGSGSTGVSLSEFWSEMSDGRFSVTGSLAPEVTLPGSQASYVGTRTGFNGTADNLPALITATLAAADEVVDFRPYSDPLDPGRRVPAVIIMLAGPIGSCEGEVERVWPHRYTVSGLVGMPYETRDTLPSGEPVLVDDYIIQGADACGAPGTPSPLATLIHESGHLIGLPDLYNVADFVNNAGPIGAWDVMAKGNYDAEGNVRHTPSPLMGWSRALLGWVSLRVYPDRASRSPVNLSIADLSNSRELVVIPQRQTNELLLLEVRGGGRLDAALPGRGLLISRVDTAIVRAGLGGNTVQSGGGGRWGVAILQADGNSDLEFNMNLGDAGDPWPGTSGRTMLSASSFPSLRAQSNSEPTGIALSAISVSGSGENMVATLVLRNDQESIHPLWDLVPGSIGPFIAGMQVDLQFELVRPSSGPDDPWYGTDPDGGPIVWSAPDSVLALLGLSLSESGRLHGVPNAATSRVELTVTATRSALEFSAIPASLGGMATFELNVVEPVALESEALVDALVSPGTKPLESAAVLYLDALGNGNGRYDIGDLVSVVRQGLIDFSTLKAHSPRFAAVIERAAYR